MSLMCYNEYPVLIEINICNEIYQAVIALYNQLKETDRKIKEELGLIYASLEDKNALMDYLQNHFVKNNEAYIPNIVITSHDWDKNNPYINYDLDLLAEKQDLYVIHSYYKEKNLNSYFKPNKSVYDFQSLCNENFEHKNYKAAKTMEESHLVWEHYVAENGIELWDPIKVNIPERC